MEPVRITTEQVKQRMATGERIVFLDTRSPAAWGESDVRIPGAIRVPPDEVEQHLREIPPPGQTIVTYCT
jgi:rhodanese-related sulfurtransferase